MISSASASSNSAIPDAEATPEVTFSDEVLRWVRECGESDATALSFWMMGDEPSGPSSSDIARVRRHLNSLEQDGLVYHARGYLDDNSLAPSKVYMITGAGIDRLDELTND